MASAAQNQDFTTFQGDAILPIFTVVGSDGVTPVDISLVTDIAWYATRNAADPKVLSKTMLTGGISFVTNGTDGRFQVVITPTDTQLLEGWYAHYASIKDAFGNVTTVSVGRMNVGPQPNWSWDPGMVGKEPLYTVRQILGDWVQSDQLQSDQQIKWALSQYSNEWLAAAECSRNLATFFARQVDMVQGELKTNYSARSRRFAAMAIDLEQRGMARGGVEGFAGGISLTQKWDSVSDTDRVPPQFVIGIFDNTLPEAPIGHQAGVGQGLPDNWAQTWGQL